MSDTELVAQLRKVEFVYRNEALIWEALRVTAQGAGKKATFKSLESVPYAAREKSMPASLHDVSLIQDVA